MDDQNTNMPNQVQPVQPISTGGFSPEVVGAGVATPENQPRVESGYEQIKQIEKAAENSEKRETQKSERKPEKNAKAEEDRREKKEIPVGIKTKYFGYNPPPSLANDTDMIKKNAGKGDKNDAKTWLLVFLDRLLKKEDQ